MKCSSPRRSVSFRSAENSGAAVIDSNYANKRRLLYEDRPKSISSTATSCSASTASSSSSSSSACSSASNCSLTSLALINSVNGSQLTCLASAESLADSALTLDAVGSTELSDHTTPASHDWNKPRGQTRSRTSDHLRNSGDSGRKTNGTNAFFF